MAKGFKINQKNLIALRALNPQHETDSYKRLYVSEEGTTATNGYCLIRVGLPVAGKGLPVSLSVRDARKLEHEMQPGKLSRVTRPKTKPPEPVDFRRAYDPINRKPTFEFTCNAELLSKVLRAAADFSQTEKNTVRLRFYNGHSAVKIDAVPDEVTGQTFTALVMPILRYSGAIPGDWDSSEPETERNDTSEQNELIFESGGRKFRLEEF